MSDGGLDDPRQEIDRLDRELVELLNQRARAVLEISRRKAQSGTAVFVPHREQQVLANVAAANAGPLKDDQLHSIWREILSSSRALQRKLKVAYLGPAHTYSHQAALKLFGDSTDMVPEPTIRDIFLETEQGRADFGVVPVENSTEGSVLFTLDSFVDSNLKVCAELSLPIVHTLMARCPRGEIQTVYSHPQALAQCRGWLAANLPRAETVQSPSTVKAAEQAAADPTGAAIGPGLAAEHYGLDILEEGVQDLATNITRFLVVGPRIASPTGRDKTALMVGIRDRVGALHDMMGVFAREGISLTNIVSRPLRGKAWEYIFFLETGGHAEEPAMGRALAELEQQCSMVKLLGSWPRT